MGQKSQLVPKLLISPSHAVIVKAQARKEIQHHDYQKQELDFSVFDLTLQ
jgi:hypothetical protein